MTTDKLDKQPPKTETIKNLRAEAKKLLAASKSFNTKTAYRSDWKTFVVWCDDHNLDCLPATPDTVVLWITHLTQINRAISTISRSLTAISQAHKLSKLPNPVKSIEVSETLKGARRTLGTAPQRAKALVWGDLQKVIDATDASFLGRRDAALLLVGWTAALRRSELVALNLGDLDFVPEGMVVTVRKSKTDQEGEQYKIGIPLATDERYCPTRRLQKWIDLAQLTAAHSPLFFSVGFQGKIWFHVDMPEAERIRLTDRMVNHVLKKYLKLAGFSTHGYSGHSLRAGFITTAAAKKIPEAMIQLHTRHRSTKILRDYIRQGNLFSDNPLNLLF